MTANRLVTLTGASGAGKTRLAIEVASRLIDAFADGVWLVELAALSDPRLVPQAVAKALEVKEQPTRPVIETLGDYLALKKLLLVLDNVEHLLDACVRLVDVVLRRCRDVAVLVTSRERLAMAGELTYRVPSLMVPGPRDDFAPDALLAYEGVRLFVDRARLLRPGFSVTSENAASLASICYRLDGIPLAIELAAPRLRSMSVEELSQGWISASHCSLTVRAQRCRGIARYGRRSTGATTCCASRRSCSCNGSRYSRAGGRWQRRKRCAPARALSTGTSSTC